MGHPQAVPARFKTRKISVIPRWGQELRRRIDVVAVVAWNPVEGQTRPLAIHATRPQSRVNYDAVNPPSIDQGPQLCRERAA
eukprot:4538933-Pyramimonas_sp.AAC.1